MLRADRSSGSQALAAERRRLSIFFNSRCRRLQMCRLTFVPTRIMSAARASAALWQRIKTNGQKIGLDPRLGTELGRLALHDELTSAEVSAGFRIAAEAARRIRNGAVPDFQRGSHIALCAGVSRTHLRASGGELSGTCVTSAFEGQGEQLLSIRDLPI